MKCFCKGLIFKAIVLFAVVLFWAGSATSTTYVLPDDDNLIVGARAIITGKVLSIGCRLDEQDRIFTYVTVRVQEILKGQISQRRIVLKQAGGQVGNRGSTIFGSPEFKTDEQVLLYLGSWPDGSLRVHQLMLGKFSITVDTQTGNKYVTRGLSADNFHALSEASHSRGAITNRMELSAYKSMVRARLGANWERSQTHEQTYYSETPLLMQPPEYKLEAVLGKIFPRFR